MLSRLSDEGRCDVGADQAGRPRVLRAGLERPRPRCGRRLLRGRPDRRGRQGGCFRYFEAFPDLHIALDDVIAEGDRVFVRSTMTGTHDGEYKGIPATGRHLAAESAEVFRVADGRFVGYWCLANVAGLMRQLTEDVAVTTG